MRSRMLNFIKEQYCFKNDGYTEEQMLLYRYQPPEGGLGDFALAKGDDGWHLFHISRLSSMPIDCHLSGQEFQIGHAFGKDLLSFESQSPAIIARPHKWDSAHLWAPSVVYDNGLWYMFYTGMKDDIYQKIGVVTSKDLWHWDYPVEDAIIDVANCLWAKVRPNQPTNCRDPYVCKFDDTWFCYYTSMTKDEKASIGLMISKDLLQWEDKGPCIIRPIQNGETRGNGTWAPESPCCFERKGLYYLTFNLGCGIKYAVSDNPYDFNQSELNVLVTSPMNYHVTYNFEILDLESGLFAFATGYYSGLNYGFVEFWEDRMSIVSMIKKPGLER